MEKKTKIIKDLQQEVSHQSFIEGWMEFPQKKNHKFNIINSQFMPLQGI